MGSREFLPGGLIWLKQEVYGAGFLDLVSFSIGPCQAAGGPLGARFFSRNLSALFGRLTPVFFGLVC